MFSDAQELVDAIEGHYGEEVQQEAIQTADELGLLDQWDGQQASAEDEQIVAGIEAELERLEANIGRSLTGKEVENLVQRIPAEAFQGGPVPDLVTPHAEALKSRATNDRESRVQFMAEVADDAKAAQEPQETPGPIPDYLQTDDQAGGQYDDAGWEE